MTDFKEPEIKLKYKGPKGTINSLAFNPNDTQLASGSSDHCVMVWHCEQQKKAYRYSEHQDQVTCVTYSPSGKTLASSSLDKTVRLWKPTLNGGSNSFKGHTSGVRCVRFSPREQYLLTASDDKTLKLWSADRNRFIYSMCEHVNWVRSANFSQKSMHTFSDLPGRVNEVVFYPCGNSVAAAAGNSVMMWDTRVQKLIQIYEVQDNLVVSSIAFDPSGKYLLAGLSDSTLKMFDLSEGRLCYTLQGRQGGVRSVQFSNTGQHFACAGVDKEVEFWKSNLPYV